MAAAHAAALLQPDVQRGVTRVGFAMIVAPSDNLKSAFERQERPEHPARLGDSQPRPETGVGPRPKNEPPAPGIGYPPRIEAVWTGKILPAPHDVWKNNHQPPPPAGAGANARSARRVLPSPANEVKAVASANISA